MVPHPPRCRQADDRLGGVVGEDDGGGGASPRPRRAETAMPALARVEPSAYELSRRGAPGVCAKGLRHAAPGVRPARLPAPRTARADSRRPRMSDPHKSSTPCSFVSTPPTEASERRRRGASASCSNCVAATLVECRPGVAPPLPGARTNPTPPHGDFSRSASVVFCLPDGGEDACQVLRCRNSTVCHRPYSTISCESMRVLSAGTRPQNENRTGSWRKCDEDRRARTLRC